MSQCNIKPRSPAGEMTIVLYFVATATHCLSHTSISRVNMPVSVALIMDLLEKWCRDVEKSMHQFILLDSRLMELKKRLGRVKRRGHLPLQYSLEVQRDTLEGVICQYKTYLRRRLGEIRHAQQIVISLTSS